MGKMAEFKCFSDDEVIVRQNAQVSEMYKIISGKVVIYLNYKLPNEHVIGVLSEGGYFGELSILSGRPQAYTAVAYNQVMVMRITEDSFDDFIRNNVENTKDIMRNLANMLIQSKASLDLLLEDLNAYGKAQPKTLDRVAIMMKQYALQNVLHEHNFFA